MSAAAPANVVLTLVLDTGSSLSGIKVDGTLVTKSGKYTTTGQNTVTILGAYLATLTAAAHAFELDMSDGSTATATITVTA